MIPEGDGSMAVIIPPTEEHILLRKINNVFSKLWEFQKVDVILKSQDYSDIDDFIDSYFEILVNELLSYDEDYTHRNVRRAWNELTDYEQLCLLLEIFGYEDEWEFLEVNFDFLKDHFRETIESIHWVVLMPWEYHPREEAEGIVKEMLADPAKEWIIEKYKLDRNIDVEKLSDEELEYLHFLLNGVIY